MNGFASFVVARKLKFIKEKLNKWNKGVSWGHKTRQYDVLCIIHSLDAKKIMEWQRKDAKDDWKNYFDGDIVETNV